MTFALYATPEPSNAVSHLSSLPQRPPVRAGFLFCLPPKWRCVPCSLPCPKWRLCLLG